MLEKGRGPDSASLTQPITYRPLALVHVHGSCHDFLNKIMLLFFYFFLNILLLYIYLFFFWPSRTACGIFPNQGLNQCLLYWDHGVCTIRKSPRLIIYDTWTIQRKMFLVSWSNDLFLTLHVLTPCHVLSYAYLDHDFLVWFFFFSWSFFYIFSHW